jgi:DNA-binding SARP family transcriptional activator
MANDAVAFLVLGPLEVRAGEGGIALGGPRQRAVLADLVLHAGSVVSRDRLIDDLWAGRPPPTADAVVQNAVSRLRVALGKKAIDTIAPGYVLRAETGAIDARRFERLVHDARPLPPAERSAALRDALALWRGSPFADLSYENFLQGEIARLDELRLTALEDRIEAEIELGAHDDVIPDAARLAGQHPDRERLCRLLMLAHARAGRQQDAIDAYEATRRALDEQWGLKPSPETRALHRMILTQDAAMAPAQPVAAAIGTVRRPVSLLLVEPLVDDDLELEAAGAVLHDVRRTVGDIVSRHGGALSPESAAELVAAFGADGAHEDDVVRAGRAAVEIREALRSRRVEARLAIGTGRILVEGSTPVLVGAVVGRARRALRDAGADEIQLTAVAARLGGDAFELDADGRLLGVSPTRPPPRVGLAPLVGRTEELARLHAAFDRVVETGKPGHVVVVGEAGIGKSRLVAAFADDVRAVVLDAACTPSGEGITFLPLRELADRAAALDDSAPALGELETADAALAAARTLLGHFAAQGPVVVVLDDLHWAVPTFLDLVEYVVRAIDGPLLVVSVTRPELLERRPAWSEGATTLEPIGGDDARLLVDALPERDALDETLASAILDTAAGVPLFLEQLAAHAVEAGLVDGVPMMLDALLASRIDALEPGERDVLSRAAVVGRAFSRESLGALTPDAETRELAGRLASLERRRLVRPRGDEHEFVHPLVRGAAYDAIGRADRAAMHETFARWLDAHGGLDELVGTHLERAANDSRESAGRAALGQEASGLLARAGQDALLSYDHAAAANLLERAAALLDEDSLDRMEIECGLGHALKGVGRREEATALLGAVAERARQVGQRPIQLRARVELVHPLLTSGRLTPEAAGALLDEALGVLTEVADVLGIARTESAYTLIYNWCNLPDRALAHAERADAAYRRLGRGGQVDTIAVMAATRGSTTVRDATRACERAIAEHPNSSRRRAYLLAYLGVLCAMSGDRTAAREASDEARSQLQELGEDVGLGTSAAQLLGEAEAIAGAWPRAREIFEHGLAYTRDRPQHRDFHAYFLARLGETELERGDPRAAAALAEEARRLAVPGDIETEVWWRRVAARALSADGQTRKALRLGREALTTADSTEEVLPRSGARLDLGEVQLRAGRRSEAMSLVGEALELLDRKGAVLPAEHARARFAELLAEDHAGRAATAARDERRTTRGA